MVIIALLVVVGLMQQLNWPYYIGVVVATCLSVYQQKLIFHHEKAHCFKAFLNSNYFGMAVFIGLLLSYLI
jgi:4-hydroxybenzoate polyprenyltransferase